MTEHPRLLITLGDVAGIGPEIVARAWPELQSLCRPAVVGDIDSLRQAADLVGSRATVRPIQKLEDAEPSATTIPCLPGSKQDLSQVVPGQLSAQAGRAAYDFLCTAIDLTLGGEAQGIVTAPLHKEGLRAAGVPYPGHTEILAERTGTSHYGMALYCEGLAVVHVTLHMALRDVFRHLTTEAILEKIRLLEGLMSRLLDRKPRIGVAALNPHASDGGLFGDEEARIIGPAVAAAQAEEMLVTGPWPCDTLFVRARAGEFDGVVAMYHDQGHIALKLLGGLRSVNISVGLPIIRTSVAHGTAYDIASRGIADATSLVEATRVAARLARANVGA
jgi:4-hydroxythreonine-4-phosphate dehydrogenase